MLTSEIQLARKIWSDVLRLRHLLSHRHELVQLRLQLTEEQGYLYLYGDLLRHAGGLSSHLADGIWGERLGNDTSRVLSIELHLRGLEHLRYGMAVLEWKILNSHDTKFRLGSITKQDSAALILLVQQDGKLNINTRSDERLLPRWPNGYGQYRSGRRNPERRGGSPPLRPFQ